MRMHRLLAIGLLLVSSSAWASGPGRAVLSDVVAAVPRVDGVGYGGVVTESGLGTPMPNVEVTLLHETRPAVVGRTDAFGRFRFPSVRPGLYRLEARVEGFELKVLESVVVSERLMRNDHLVLQPVVPLAPVETPTESAAQPTS